MDAKLKVDTVNYDAYKNAKPSRPGWANALIVTLVLFLAAVGLTVVGSQTAPWFYLAAFVTLIVAGVLALTGMRRAT